MLNPSDPHQMSHLLPVASSAAHLCCLVQSLWFISDLSLTPKASPCSRESMQVVSGETSHRRNVSTYVSEKAGNRALRLGISGNPSRQEERGAQVEIHFACLDFLDEL
ncbi:hypothetical protein AV530_017588 [Patagioenas fasciata monilis]|uniref:Uncharacterized protein n=1 Tax=Patagioenas fasciata monilis TaxID=372326 RepID=A0A1V4J9B2_PATFA|nr:hypothetical protein AV530_017588 [Patagioenas fasciata monilis]